MSVRNLGWLGIFLAALGLGIAVLAIILGGVALSRTDGPLPNEYVNHGNVPDIGDKWLFRGRDLTNRAHSPRTQINSGNVKQLVQKFASAIGQDPSLGGTIAGAVLADINWGSVVVDDNYIFLATHNQRNAAGTLLVGTGYFMAFNRATGQRVWNKAVDTYSLDNSNSVFEAAPAVHGDYLYIGSKNRRPQTYAATSYQSCTNPKYFGAPSTAKGVRTHVYSINKHTGAEVWVREIGAVATKLDDPDNLLNIAMSPVAFDMDPTGGNNKIPVVAIGTSSGNSFFYDFSACDETTAYGYQAITGYAGFGTDPRTRVTDVGRMVLLNGNDGTIISTTMMGPPLYVAGDTLSEESIVYGEPELEDGDFQIWHIVDPADLLAAGELNPIGPRYGKSKMIISLMPGATIPAGSPVVGLTVQDNTGTLVLVAAGAVPANLNYVTITMEVEFVPGTTTYYRRSPLPVATAFVTTSSGLDGTGGNVPARIVKRLRVGDTLTDQDAYESNLYGASVWGSSPSINFDKNGVPTELYVATGQAHKIPYDEVRRFTVTNPPGNFTRPIERLFNIKQKNDAFAANPTIENLERVRQAQAERLADLKTGRALPLSVRSRNFHSNSIVAINLRPGHIGEIIWTKKAADYDTWRIGLVYDSQRQDEGGLKIGFTDIEAHHGLLRGFDSDHGEAPYFCPNCGERGADYLVAPNKGGAVTVIKLSDVNTGPTVATETAQSILNNPGLLGGSNYGSSMIGHRIYTVQSNEAAAFVSTVDRPFNKRSLPPVLEWYPVNQHDPATIQPFTHRQSFLSCYDFLNDSVVFEVPLQTLPPGNSYATVTAFSSGADLIYVQPNSLTLQIRKATDGSLVHTITLDSAGVSNLAVLDRELIIANGRSNFLGDNPAGTNYVAARNLYSYKLP